MMTGNVLIAEDEALIAEELSDRLKNMGLSIAGVAASGEDAVSLAQRTRPDLILMDIRLRGRIDGIEAAGAIRTDFDVPLIYLTAHSDDATIARATRTEPSAYLIKPFAERDLRIAIELALHKHAAERLLRESEQRYATTLTSIGDAVIATDADGRITFMNPVAESLTGWPTSDACGLPIDTVFHTVDNAGAARTGPVHVALLENVVTGLQSGTLLVRRGGERIPIDDSAAPIHDSHQRVRGLVVVFRDIRGRLQAEEAMRKAEARLRETEKLEALGRLAGGVAHDMNNLLTVVIGCADLLLDDIPPGDAHRDIVGEIKSAGDRAASLARQLLAFGRRQVIVPTVLDLNAVIRSAVHMLRRIIGEDITIVTRLDDNLKPVRADATQMEQVIINIVINARDAMPSGGTLTIETSQEMVDRPGRPESEAAPPGWYVVLSISDTGSGIDAETQKHLFEPFFSTKPIGRGAGLGLASVHGIVTQSGGWIDVSSEIGRGSTFRIYLPIAEGAASPSEKLDACARTGGTETVLVAEDDADVRSLVCATLQNAGYTVISAAHGAEALDLSTRHPRIDLLLTDTIMPQLSGRLLAERMTARNPGLKVLFMSGYMEDQLLREGIETDRMPFIQKPFSIRDLTAAVRNVLDRKQK